MTSEECKEFFARVPFGPRWTAVHSATNHEEWDTLFQLLQDNSIRNEDVASQPRAFIYLHSLRP